MNGLLDIWSSLLLNATIWTSALVSVCWLLVRLIDRLPPVFTSWVWRIIFLKSVVALVWITPIELSVLPSQSEDVAFTSAGSGFISAITGQENVESKDVSPNIVSTSEKIHSTYSFRYILLSILFFLWLVGVLFNIFLTSRRFLRTFVIRRDAEDYSDSYVLGILDHVCQQFKIKSPGVILSSRVKSPMVIGIVRPTIVMPQDVSFSTQEWNLILAHEVAHIKRHDLIWSLLPIAAQAVYFFNPLIWIAQREWVLAQEVACDEQAILTTHSKKSKFSRLLLDVIERDLLSYGERTTALGMAESINNIKRRILAMDRFRRLGKFKKNVFAFTTLALGTFIIVPWQLTATESDPLELIKERFNLGFERNFTESISGDVQAKYRGATQDFTDQVSGNASARIVRQDYDTPRPDLRFCMDVSGIPVTGKILKYSGSLKTDVTQGYAALHMWVGSRKTRKRLGQDHMLDRGIKGKTDWGQYEIRMKIPTEADEVCIGAGLYAQGMGTVWVDDLDLEILDEGTVTGYTLDSEPVNLGFEDGADGNGIPKRWMSGGSGDGYQFSLETSNVNEGHSSLLISSEKFSRSRARVFQCLLVKPEESGMVGKKLKVAAHFLPSSFEGTAALTIKGHISGVKWGLDESSEIDLSAAGSGWQKGSIEAVIPVGATEVCFGVFVRGRGGVFVDGVSVLVVE